MRPLLFLALLFTQCTPAPIPDATLDGHWIFPTFFTTSATTIPSIVLTLDQDSAAVQELGTGEQFWKTTYGIRDEALYVGGNPTPYLKILERGAQQMRVLLHEKDTVLLHKVTPAQTSAAVLQNRLIGHSFRMSSENSFEQQLVYFGEQELLIFSKELLKMEGVFNTQSFIRVPYTADFSAGLPSMILGDYKNAAFAITSDGKKKLGNVAIGLLDAENDRELTLSIYLPNHQDVITLTALSPANEQHPLTANDWQWRSIYAGVGTLQFDPSGSVLLTENGVPRSLTWQLDDSGYLVILTEPTGEKRYIIKNFARSAKRMGFEFREREFTDLL